jgi:RHH-type proline utilization regulon transcriptional repressor/proline dehydrogenase/delta 1-pyrroline-5-carboxylate dehydrogenase
METPLKGSGHSLPSDDFGERELGLIEVKTRSIGRYLFDHLKQQRPTMIHRRWWDDRIMQWAMSDEVLKVELFRFVDVLPMLETTESVIGHLIEYLNRVRGKMPSSIRVALGLARRTPITRVAVARAARLAAMDFARRFIAGTNVREVLDAAQRERRLHRCFTLDILGEAVITGAEAEQHFQAYLDLIRGVAPTVNQWPEDPQIDRSPEGPLPRMNLSIKLSALDARFDAIDPAGVLDRAGERLRGLLRVAREQQAFINVDMESYDKKDLTLHIFKSVLSEEEFRDDSNVGIVIQCYLRDSERDLHELRDWAVERGAPVWVRLVKGAYWDYESTLAQANGWPVPVFGEKWQSDACFERLTRFLLRNHQVLRPALGSHNVRSLAHGMAVAEHLGLPLNGFELQMLYGMADGEKQAIVERGQRLRIYMPYGELIPGMAYLVRRLLENTSNDSFLRAGEHEARPVDELLRNPEAVGRLLHTVADADADGAQQPEEIEMTSQSGAELRAEFNNQPPVNFAVEEERDAMLQALADVRGQLGKTRELLIGGERLTTSTQVDTLDPSLTSRVVGTICYGSKEHALQAVAAARRALPLWWKSGAEQRAKVLQDMAQIMRERLFELAAWEVYEAGKTWREATADVDEAIDFCEYYAAGAIDLAQTRGADVPGEENRFEYLPRGVTAVIAPWNFPLAILTGMTTAALAVGNTVVMKPAEQTSVIGALLMEVALEAGIPAGVLNFVPGLGEEVGAALVEHPDVGMIAFTGSRAVGLAINRRAAEVSAAGITHVKRVLAEMGGKNAIIIDADADLDEAVQGVVKSAFGFQGQKCSACSRVIVLPSIYDSFLERLIAATRTLVVGPAEEPATDIGPVIDSQSQRKILDYIDIGRAEAREVLAVNVDHLAAQGHFVGPHIFAAAPPLGRLCQEEIFGPVLAVIRAADLDDAIRILNATDYALTAGIFSRSPANLERARREILVGNLYLNRAITGALVGRQPFGGFKLSGIGSKAGGADYLRQFVVPRTITENTMRRGFAPPESS